MPRPLCTRSLVCSPVLVATALAQQFTSPPGIGADAPSVVTSLQPFHAAATGRRFQYVVNDARAVPGPGGVQINQLALRPDPSSASSTARTATITLVLDNVDFRAQSTTFASNYSGSETSYALGTVNLPATIGTSGFAISFPLSAPFTYFGTANTAQPNRTALLFEFRTTAVVSGTLYSLDCADGTSSPVVGTSSYLGLQPCVVPPNTAGFDIVKRSPTTSAGLTTLAQHGQRGPVATFGILVVGLTDPNTTFGGALCAPLRAAPDISLNVTSDALGSVGGFTNPVNVTFPDLDAPAALYTQLVMFDPNRTTPVQVSLSDAIRFDVTPPTVIERSLLYSTSNAAATTGTRTTAFVPVLRCN